MELSNIYTNTQFYFVPNPIKEILENLLLLDFTRTRSGKVQTFSFIFLYKEKKYILEHSFLYHGSGVDNWFKFKKPLFAPKPFNLSKDELIRLSSELMKPINEWNSINK